MKRKIVLISQLHSDYEICKSSNEEMLLQTAQGLHSIKSEEEAHKDKARKLHKEVHKMRKMIYTFNKQACEAERCAELTDDNANRIEAEIDQA